MAKKPLTYTKFFALLTIALIIIYFIGNWISTTYELIWIVPEDYVLYGALASAVVAFLAFLFKK